MKGSVDICLSHSIGEAVHCFYYYYYLLYCILQLKHFCLILFHSLYLLCDTFIDFFFFLNSLSGRASLSSSCNSKMEMIFRGKHWLSPLCCFVVLLLPLPLSFRTVVFLCRYALSLLPYLWVDFTVPVLYPSPNCFCLDMMSRSLCWSLCGAQHWAPVLWFALPLTRGFSSVQDEGGCCHGF